MNNTKTLAIVVVLIVALVVGVTSAAVTTAHSVFAQKKGGQDGYKKGGENTYKKGRHANGGYENGNTLTVQAAKQHGIASGFDNTLEQEVQNLICTHPSSICVSEGSETNSTDTTDGDGGGSGQGNGTGD